MAKDDLVVFTVEGHLEFPWDMLRYDSCWPYENDDSAMINRRTDRDMNVQRRRIVLQGCTVRPLHGGNHSTGAWSASASSESRTAKPSHIPTKNQDR